MRILHVSYSRAGGIGNVVSELCRAQILAGHQVEWQFATTGPLSDTVLQHPIEAIMAGLDDFGLRKRGFQGPISVLRSGQALLRRVSAMMHRFDVIHLHGGTLDLRDFARIETSAKVVISHHDMRLVTGACHQSITCERFKSSCSSCPALKAPFRHLANRNRIEAFPASWRHTAPSQAFADILAGSSLLYGKRVSVIPNPLPAELIELKSAGANNELLTIIGSSASSTLRNLGKATIQRLEEIALTNKLKLVAIGGNSYDSEKVKNLGVLSRIQVFEIMSRSQACFTPNKYESFSTAGLEALFLGSLLIAPVDSPQGELAESLNRRVDIEGSDFRLTAPSNRKSVQAVLTEKFDVRVVSKRLESLYFD